MNNKQREESLTLEILEAIEEQADVTQRHLARRLGVALGLANSYLKRCVRKGLIKINQAPANRYAYYLTPKGFAEKSRLTGQYLSYSFSFYRRAGESCTEAFAECHRNGWRHVGLYGASDLAEIACVRVLEHDVEICCIYDESATGEEFLKHPLVKSLGACDGPDAWLLTDLSDPLSAFEKLRAEVDEARIVVPRILGIGHKV